MVVDGGVESVSGRIAIGAGSRVGGDIEAVNGDITLTRVELDGGIENVNGTITLQGTRVARGIETVNGDIFIGRDSVVRGDLIVRRPRGISLGRSVPPKVTIESGATVDGRLVFEREVTLSIAPDAKVAHAEPVER